MKYILIVLLTTLFVGCSLFNNEQIVPEKAIGEWEWVRTSGGWGTNISADSVDYTINLVLDASEARWFRNDKLVTKYYVREGKKGWEDGAFFMKPSDSKHSCAPSRVNYNEEENRLVIGSANCTDQPYHYFKRAWD